ncbi:UNVERIFIED_ORG: hypothetical protein ABIC48_003862 [Burkholderia territorii]
MQDLFDLLLGGSLGIGDDRRHARFEIGELLRSVAQTDDFLDLVDEGTAIVRQCLETRLDGGFDRFQHVHLLEELLEPAARTVSCDCDQGVNENAPRQTENPPADIELETLSDAAFDLLGDRLDVVFGECSIAHGCPDSCANCGFVSLG